MALFLTLLGFLQLVPSTENHRFLDQSKSQAEYYISEIDRGRNPDENLWALSVLGTENPEVETFIEKKAQQYDYQSSSLSLFINIENNLEQQLKKIVFKTGSADLLLSLLLQIESKEEKQQIYDQYVLKFKHLPKKDIDYRSLFQSIINNQPITSKVLPNKAFLLPHFFILFEPNYHNYISQQYLEGIVDEWELDATKFNLKLGVTLSKVTYFRTLYLLNKYSDINYLYNFLINNKLFPNSSVKLKIYRYLDYSMYRLGYYNRNLEIARNFTLPLATYLKQEALKLRIKFATGINLYSIGKLKEAEEIYQEVLNEAIKNNTSLPLTSLYNNLALSYYKLGKYDKYLDLQFQALQAANKVNNYSHQLKIFHNLFIYYSTLNDPETALHYLEVGQELVKNKGNRDDLGSINMLLGSFYRKFEGNFEKAHKYYNKAERLLKIYGSNTAHLIEVLNEQAKTYEQQEKFIKALEKYDRIIALTQEQKSPSYIDALVNKAVVYLKVDNLFQAKRFINKFKNYNLNQLDFEELVKAKTVEANYLYQTGNSTEALSILRPTLKQVVERARNSADLKTGFWHIADEFLNAFELAATIYIEEAQFDKAVEVLDRLKTINDASLYQNPLVRASMLNETELTRYKRLTGKLDQLRKKLLAAPEGERFDIQQAINQLKLKKGELDKELTDQAHASPVTVREVQNELSARELVLHITELKNKYYIARIFRSKVSIQIIELDSTLRNIFETSVRELAHHEADLNSLYSITKVLEIKDIPERIEEITVIPDSYLYQLPLDVLPMEKPVHSYSYGEARYLIERFETHYLTSLNDFRYSYDLPSSTDYALNFVGYGVSTFEDYTKQPLVPLPFAKTEVRTIADKLTNLSNVQTFVNSSSTKATFKRTAPDARILHLATHSKVSQRDPLFSTFYMSKTTSHPDSTFYDQVFAYELFELKLNNEMIMLNSCESGSGSYLQGTGIMGISRALQYAGANSLVLNLWSVNDMLASDFAIYFYSQLNKGKSKAAAMRATKLYFLENKNASPHFWGPYMLLGNSEPIVNPHREMNMIVAGTFSFYFLLIVGLSLFQVIKRKLKVEG